MIYLSFIVNVFDWNIKLFIVFTNLHLNLFNNFRLKKPADILSSVFFIFVFLLIRMLKGQCKGQEFPFPTLPD